MVIKGDTRSLDYSSCAEEGLEVLLGCSSLGFGV